MFEEWKLQTNQYVEHHINRTTFKSIAHELSSDIAELSDHYTAILLENGVIDENGNETEIDFDEDDLITINSEGENKGTEVIIYIPIRDEVQDREKYHV